MNLLPMLLVMPNLMLSGNNDVLPMPKLALTGTWVTEVQTGGVWY